MYDCDQVQCNKKLQMQAVLIKWEKEMDILRKQLLKDGKIVIKQKSCTYETNSKNHIRTSSGVRFVC